MRSLTLVAAVVLLGACSDAGSREALAFMGLRPYRGDSLLITTMEGSSGGSTFTNVMILADDGSYGRDVELWVHASGPRSETVSHIGMPSAGLHTTLADGSFLLEGGSGIPLEGPAGDLVESTAPLVRVSPEGPDSVPLVQDLRVDRSGHAWLELWTPIGPRGREYARGRGYALDRAPARWIVLDPEGALHGSVEVPAEFEVREIGEGYLLGVVTDALGVEYLRRHHLDRGSAEGSIP